ncbi:PREDICTED: probable 28S ribosomal protein S25, mitochondrial [Ceratosolen solmsi marchali]|uniref:Small ribosomal subunit protein mS25 n=1 Tax=Ceratosolen solmsi marchali TaxID=326594 RepID=A0AAJ7E1H1_9HYME|nr:PREDICTED: probable 28S ribosomal protein S25, mitochondrial [Ceratosolen solmsi marchali]
MPFMIGTAPIRRTVKYLEAGKLVLKKSIQIMLINYNSHGDHHNGIRNFVFWHLSQILYKNPDVQVVTIKNKTPSPFISCFYENGKKMLIDVDMKSKDEIMDHLLQVIGKSKKTLMEEDVLKMKQDNPANFGFGCEKSCICTIPGQLPCPGTIPLPYHLRGKYLMSKNK